MVMILTQHQISPSVRPVSNHYKNSAGFTGTGLLTVHEVTEGPSHKLTDAQVSSLQSLYPYNIRLFCFLRIPASAQSSAS